MAEKPSDAARANIRRISKAVMRITDHLMAVKVNQADWGVVGDLGRIAELVENAADFAEGKG